MNESVEDITNKLKEIIASTSQDRNDIKGLNYYIGQGILEWDNFCIQVRNIVVISKYREGKKSLTSLIIIMVCCFFFMMIPLDFFRFLGMTGFLIGALCVWLILRANEKRMFRITIKMTNGDRFTIEDRREEFIDQIMLVIKNSMREDGKSYFIALNSGNIQYSDNGGISSIGDGNWHTFFSVDDEKEKSGERKLKPDGQENTVIQINSADITFEDWENIKKFTEQAIMKESQDEKLTNSLMRLRTFIIKKDRSGIEKELRAMEKEQMAQFMNNAKDQEEKKKMLGIIKKIVNSNRRSL